MSPREVAGAAASEETPAGRHRPGGATMASVASMEAAASTASAASVAKADASAAVSPMQLLAVAASGGDAAATHHHASRNGSMVEQGGAGCSSSGPVGVARDVVAEDVEVPPAKHELHHEWCLWVLRRPSGGYANSADVVDRRDCVQEFSTVEDFWCIVRHAYPPSMLVDANYSLFRKDVSPSWEDAAFVGGGRWVARLSRLGPQRLDSLWLTLKMALVGEAFAETENVEEVVCGASLTLRTHVSKLALWLSHGVDDKQVLMLGHAFRAVLADTEGVPESALLDVTFEDFGRHQVTLWLPRPGEAEGSTAGIFQ